MTKARKTTMLIVSAILVCGTILAGCSNSKKTNSESAPSPSASERAEWELGSEPIEFTMYGHYDWYDVPAWDSTVAGRWIKENKGVNIVPIAASGNADQKLSTMIASSSLPNVIWMDRGAEVERLREAGMLVPFDDYLDKYPNLKTWMGDNMNLLRSSDGKLYQFPNWYTNRPNGNAGYVINKKIYSELGSPKLETTDDLYDYLVKVKAKYGESIIPLEPHLAKDLQGLGVLYTGFAENALYEFLGMRAVPQGDKLTSLFTDPTFREAQQYISKLYREKLISQDAFTQTLDQIEEKVMQGRVAVYAGSNPIAMDAHQELSKNDPEAGYFMIWPIRKEGLDKNKIYPGTYSALGWNVSVITKTAKDPEKIFAFLDWYTGPEGQALLFFGPEGKNWKGFDEDGHPIYTDEYDAKEVLDLQQAHDRIMWNGNTGYIDPAKMKYESKLPPEQQNWAARYQNEVTWPTQADVTEYINLDPEPNSDLGLVKQRVDDIFTQAYAQSVMAKSDAEVLSILDKAEQNAQDAGYTKLLEWRTEVWQNNKRLIAGE